MRTTEVVQWVRSPDHQREPSPEYYPLMIHFALNMQSYLTPTMPLVSIFVQSVYHNNACSKYSFCCIDTLPILRCIIFLSRWNKAEADAQCFDMVSELNNMFPGNGAQQCATGFKMRFVLFHSCLVCFVRKGLFKGKRMLD